jgi:uncharacterized protein
LGANWRYISAESPLGCSRGIVVPVGVVATPEALSFIRRLKEIHGPLLFLQSGGCCDGSVPLCLRRDEFRVGSCDVLLGVIEDTPFYVGVAQFEYLKKAQQVLDVIPGDLDSFSLEAGQGVRFITRTSDTGNFQLAGGLPGHS